MTKAFLTLLLAGIAAPAQAATDQYNLFCQGTLISTIEDHEQSSQRTWTFRIDERSGHWCSDDDGCGIARPLDRRGGRIWLAEEIDEDHSWYLAITDQMRMMQLRVSAPIDYLGRVMADCHRMKFTGIPDDAFGGHEPMDDN
ncbi:hypothetical protein [Croceicoccus gelatinilyticus]|uniref:hypothetical protein n=1 Tax=Croceicoccus gelatinilyticus TaxID=2835536 RepID=UPI001BD13545|nr:hypothetical protein [Croceicoccus gelatinilyticus]MBS7671301.1 hypothetical protein [Croceicoccus gelatinilyticus]